jgi:hypothetical protein
MSQKHSTGRGIPTYWFKFSKRVLGAEYGLAVDLFWALRQVSPPVKFVEMFTQGMADALGRPEPDGPPQALVLYLNQLSSDGGEAHLRLLNNWWGSC